MALELVDTVAPGTMGPSTTRKTKDLDKNAFLLLLTKQMQYQDPLSPMDNTEYVAQMANFSTLEQITNMGKSITQLVSALGQNYKTEAMTYLGMEVNATPSGQVESITGEVTAVRFENGEAVFTVNGQDIKLAEINNVKFPS
ncbi:MAG TPA: flagellar hook capping FlgD N-terminal domain-containing protein [Candidatus Ozemobacteraceae bacterium]|nr:flagellar hook capping FlgD N-terminal domain-containing protein [Candidatus Ozemobacteraceae bacterium]